MFRKVRGDGVVKRLLAAFSLLIVLSTPSYADIYRVRKGDSLYKIAKKFHTTVSKIKRLNGLRSSIIRPGQRLIVPGIRKKPVKSLETIKFLERKSENAELTSSPTREIYPITNIVYREAEALVDVLSTPLSASYDNWNLSILNDPQYRGTLFKVLAEIFKKLKNTPYVFGGSNPRYGLDCSSFTMYVYRKLGIKLPRTARTQFNVGVPVDRKELKVGDLVFFRTYARFPSHVGIYIGNGKFVHFSSMYHGLAISSLNDRYFKRRFIGAKRVLSEKTVKRILYAKSGKN